MGTGASTHHSGSENDGPEISIKPNLTNGPRASALTLQSISSKGKATVLKLNPMTPMIIKVGKEEYQHYHHAAESSAIMSRIAPDKPEHHLVLDKYFLVKDNDQSIDKLSTQTGSFCAPNYRRAHDKHGIFTLGQPTGNGLCNLIHSLRSDDKYDDILLFNLRSEPVLFVSCSDSGNACDLIPFTPRKHPNLNSTPFTICSNAIETHDLEIQLQKSVFELLLMKDCTEFYFYDSLTDLSEEPHVRNAYAEDFLKITQEVYAGYCLHNPGISYTRLCLKPMQCPSESEIDRLLSTFKKYDRLWSGDWKPSVVINCKSGIGRTDIVAIMTCLLLSHANGFENIGSAPVVVPKVNARNLLNGEYEAVCHLVENLSDGLLMKFQVDAIIDICSWEHFHLRRVLLKTKKDLEECSDRNTQLNLLKKASHLLEIYMLLICFNAYLHDQFKNRLSILFGDWMLTKCPFLYRSFSLINSTERTAPVELLLSSKARCLVADDSISDDMVGSFAEVGISNYRRLGSLPLYGMAQPNAEGLDRAVKSLLGTKCNFDKIIWVNLRQDAAVECDGKFYNLRECTSLSTSLCLSSSCSELVTQRDRELKQAVLQVKEADVYNDIDKGPVTKNFGTVLTADDLYEKQHSMTPYIQYHRIPFNDHCAPNEKDVDRILSVILANIPRDSDSQQKPVFMFTCRTGKGRATMGTCIAGLIYFHTQGFPYGARVGEEERTALRNAKYSKGEFEVVQNIVRMLPDGRQRKREVDFVLDLAFETMTTLHFHLREIVFVAYNKAKNAKTSELRHFHTKRSLHYLERYIFMILLNTYLFEEKDNRWKTQTFSQWIFKVAAPIGLYSVLNNLHFPEFDEQPSELSRLRGRWISACGPAIPVRGKFS